MKAMITESPGTEIVLKNVPKPTPKEGQLLIKISACGLCRTDLHIIDGELKHPKLPLIQGHQIVGRVEELGPGTNSFQIGDRVGVPWLGHTCGKCFFCLSGRENLCDHAQYTGYHLDGGFAEYAVSYADFTFHLPENMSDIEIAPLLCAGLIGYRCYRKAAPEKRLGLYGFGAAAHILTQLAQYEGIEIYAFTRKNDKKGQDFAKRLGCVWAGGSNETPPKKLDAAIIFAPVGELVPASLKNIEKGGRCICGGIHMSDIPSFAYTDLWEERSIESVANLTRQDGIDFLKLAPKIPIKTAVTLYPLEDLNRALEDLRQGNFEGAAVITPDSVSKNIATH